MARHTLTRLEWLERLEEHAITRGGRLLSDAYLGSQAKHWWQCRSGHAFAATAANFLHNDSWCPFCAGNARLSLDMLEAVVEAPGGELLPFEGQLNRDAHLRFRRAAGHEFDIGLQNYSTRRCAFCVECATDERRAALLERARRTVERAGYRLLSSTWDDHRGVLTLECPVGHRWRMRDWNLRVGGQRCGKCWRGERSA